MLINKIHLLGILSFLGVGCADKKPTEEKAMLLWEDNYLMIEIISSKNITFVKKEIERVSKFGEEHYNGAGYTDITHIEEKPFLTEKLEISKKEVIGLLELQGLTRYPKLMYYGGGEPTEIKEPKSIVYGELSSGIFLEPENEILKHIWFDSYNWKEISKTKIADGLHAIGLKYDLILVDWNGNQIVDLKNKSEIEKYLNTQ